MPTFIYERPFKELRPFQVDVSNRPIDGAELLCELTFNVYEEQRPVFSTMYRSHLVRVLRSYLEQFTARGDIASACAASVALNLVETTS